MYTPYQRAACGFEHLAALLFFRRFIAAIISSWSGVYLISSSATCGIFVDFATIVYQQLGKCSFHILSTLSVSLTKLPCWFLQIHSVPPPSVWFSFICISWFFHTLAFHLPLFLFSIKEWTGSTICFWELYLNLNKFSPELFLDCNMGYMGLH